MPNTTPNVTKIPSARVALLDAQTGLISREWFRFLNNIYTISGGATQGIAQITNGGTGADNATQARTNASTSLHEQRMREKEVNVEAAHKWQGRGSIIRNQIAAEGTHRIHLSSS